MSNICEHEFEQEDPDNLGYSLVEFDLAARWNSTIRKNLVSGEFEIVPIKGHRLRKEPVTLVGYRGTLEEVVEVANQMEGGNNIKIECGIGCPLRRR